MKSMFIRKLYAKVEFLFPSVEAHGFYDADSWIKSLLPNFHRMTAVEMILKMRNKNSDVLVHEYKRLLPEDIKNDKPLLKKYYKLHIKGFLITNPGEEFPSDITFGSSCYHSRSFEKDYEVQYYMSTHDVNF
jgi:hypothetical protein